MTKKLINKIFLLLFIFLLLKIIIYFIQVMPDMKQARDDYYSGGKVSTEDKMNFPNTYSDKTISIYLDKHHPDSYNFIRNIFIFIIVIFSMTILFGYTTGEFDDFFEKYTDPPLTKFCNWIHRRNNNEEECK